MSRITQLNLIGQAHLLPGLSDEKVKKIRAEQGLSDDPDTWTTAQVEQTSNRVMEVCTIRLPEIIGWIAQLNGRLEAREDGQLAVKGCHLPETLRRAIKYYKPTLHRYVSAFPGQCWPTEGGDATLNVQK